GDNRDNSLDSRDQSPGGVGFVPLENFVGRGEIIFFSFDYGRVLSYDKANRPVFEYSAWQVWTWPTQLRFGRFFMPVK
ncbi:MAG: S26 family signal peptidase, partial [Beijerinckiaceae bacterium]